MRLLSGIVFTVELSDDMNERILELAAEAEDYADSIVDQGGEFHPAYIQKFVELIVKECADYLSACHNGNFKSLAQELKDHFGVRK